VLYRRSYYLEHISRGLGKASRRISETSSYTGSCPCPYATPDLILTTPPPNTHETNLCSGWEDTFRTRSTFWLSFMSHLGRQHALTAWLSSGEFVCSRPSPQLIRYFSSTIGQPTFYTSMKLATAGQPGYDRTANLIGAFNGELPALMFERPR